VNYSCDRAQIPAALRELAAWCDGNGGKPDQMTEGAKDLYELRI
jgi:hypothetical protein